MQILIYIVGGLGLFLYGMAVMSEGLQKVAGNRLRSAMRALTTNRFVGVLTGFGVTAIIQSSSATTVMLVSFVNAGLVSLQQSLGVIMGANIGTTVTGWLVALLGFKVKIAMLALVAVGAGFFMKLIGKRNIPYWGEVLLGFGLIFIGLDFMKDAVGGLKGAEFVTEWMSRFSADSIPSILAVAAVGAAVTMLIQSSSATMALTMTLAAQGLISFPTAAALILGENIGTTITANLAAIGASRNAKRCALAHLVFNISGVIWMVFVFRYFIQFIDAVVPGNPTNPLAIPSHMALFHSCFNIINTIIFLPLVVVLVNLVTTLIPVTKHREQESLKYIETSIMPTPSLALESARMELYKMSDDLLTMFDGVLTILGSPGSDTQAIAEEIERIEESTDRQKELITVFLRQVVQHAAAEREGHEVSNLLAHIADLERIGDHGKSILNLTNKAFNSDTPFPFEGFQDIQAIAEKCKEFLVLINSGLRKPGKDIMPEAHALEEKINSLRTRGRENHKRRLVNSTCDVTSGLIFLEMLTNFEKIGDHSYNVAERTSMIR